MPQVVKGVRELAREHKQEVLLVDFRTDKQRSVFFFKVNSQHDKQMREVFIAWLRSTLPAISYQDCYPPLPEGTTLFPYQGMIAVIASELVQPEAYKAIVERWENADGSSREPSLRLFILPFGQRQTK